MIYAVGYDIVEVARVRRLIERYADRFLDRVFTAGEQEYCARFSDSYRHLAARFAAKEAVVKALGTGFTQGIRWRDIEVYNLDSGKPEIRLVGRAKEVADSLGISAVHVSLSHSRGMASACVVAEKASAESQKAEEGRGND